MLRRLSHKLVTHKAILNLDQQGRGLKETTGIVGLAVDPDARNNLRTRLEEVLSAVKVVPEDAVYRKQVESIVHHRLKAVNSDATDDEVEAQLDFQLESLMLHCRDELRLIPQMAEWKPWDVPADQKVELFMEEEVQPDPPPETPKTAPPLPPKK